MAAKVRVVHSAGARSGLSSERPSVTLVRPARGSDVLKLSAFFLEAWREAGPGALGFAGASDEAVSEIASDGFLNKMLHSPNIQAIIAEEGRKIIGFSRVRKITEGEAELAGIVVLENFKGRGVGTRLLRKALDAARRRRFRSIYVRTEVNNDGAIRFYKNAGFNESGKAEERTGSRRVELRVLVKRLR